MFGKVGNQCNNGLDCVWCLECILECQFVGYFVYVGYIVVGFQWVWMGVVIVYYFFGYDIGISQNSFGCVFVILFLCKDVVVVFVWVVCVFGLIGKVFVQDDIGFQCFKWVNNDGQFFVFDIDQFSGV